VLGYPYRQTPGPGHPPAPGSSPAPGPNIVGAVRYSNGLAEEQRILIEDLTIPYAYIGLLGAKGAFAAIHSEPTVTGNEAAQSARLARD
jgi:hypothetical protein